MDIRAAFGAHTQWIKALVDYIECRGNRSLGLELDEKKCEIGSWLGGPGKKLEHFEEYNKLVAIHSEFHEAAREIVSLVDSGDAKSAFGNLAPGGEFERLSIGLILAFDELDRKATAGDTETRSSGPDEET